MRNLLTSSLFAFRAVRSESAYIEKRLQVTFSSEVQHAADLISAELVSMQQELNAAVSLPVSEIPEGIVPPNYWKDAAPLLQTVFLVPVTGGLPKQEPIVQQGQWIGESAHQQDQQFFEKNAAVFQDEERIPVYKDIAVAYKKDIIKEAGKSETSQKGASSLDTYTDQVAKAEFQQSAPIREKVYAKARAEGQHMVTRNVGLNALTNVQPEQLNQPDLGYSRLIVEELKFSEITGSALFGMFPRFIDNKLQLIFWKKFNDKIAVCLINADTLRQRIIGRLPNLYSTARILTVLDENGISLVNSPAKRTIDWKKPFVSVEISELLPRWEAAVYLIDPGTLVSQARVTATITWILVFILFITIITAGSVLVWSFHNQLKLAVQKTTFVTNVSHELKTPLTSIRMFAEMLRDQRQPDAEKQKAYLDIMASETERLTRLINNVLDFSRIESGKKAYNFASVDIVSLVSEMFENQKVRLEHNGFTARLILPAGQVFIKADSEAIKQALINLLSNAEKYSSERKEIEVELLQGVGRVLININDRGIGIPPGKEKDIFKDFYRVDDSLTAKVKGTGLGLAISRRIIQDHAGDIIYIPRAGGGSIFQIQLPITGG